MQITDQSLTGRSTYTILEGFCLKKEKEMSINIFILYNILKTLNFLCFQTAATDLQYTQMEMNLFTFLQLDKKINTSFMSEHTELESGQLA